ncbi:MAG: hypothetical protein IKH23_02305 [Clostridiales bacterium]|nr:hypothetical protein [Clostridiales bacterium]
MKIKRLLSMLVAGAVIAGTMPVSVFAGRLNYEPEETEVPGIVETEEKETSKPEVKETKPEVKETEKPEETEAPKETEAAKETEAPEETEAPKESEAPAEAEETKPEVPEETEKEEAVSEPDTEKVPEQSASVKAKNSTEFDGKSIKISNGILSWNAIDGAVKYRIAIEGGEKYVNTNSYDIGAWIDELIRDRQIFKEDSYYLFIAAYDADDDRITYTDATIKYKSNAEPAGQLAEITNPSISSDGILTWDQYGDGSDIEGYYIRIFGKETYTDWANPYDLKYDLKQGIESAASSGWLTELTSYKIQIVARKSSTNAFVAETSVFTYNYKSANTMTVKAKKAAKVSARKAKKKNQSVKISKVLTVKKPIGKVTYAKASGNAKIIVNKATGKITLKKKIKKGTYKVQLLVTAAGNSTHIKVTKKVTVKIKVK